MDEKLKSIDIKNETSFTDIVDVVYLTPQNTDFSVSKNGFLMMISDCDVKPEVLFEEKDDGEKPHGGHMGPPPEERGADGGEKPKHRMHHGFGKDPIPIKYTDDGRRDYGRVTLHRAFPFDMPDKIISVRDDSDSEIGIIRDINEFDEKTRAMLINSLDNKYFIPEIKRIISEKDRFGYVYFKCETDKGECDFIVKNPFSSIIRLSETQIIIIDVDGNRYSVTDVSRLDRKSYRKIELYL